VHWGRKGNQLFVDIVAIFSKKQIFAMQSKVIRVLNLWQKNAVFPPEVIQPLFDMADSSHPKYKEVAQYVNSKGASSSGISASKSNSQDNSTNLNGNKEAAVSFEETSNDGNQVQVKCCQLCPITQFCKVVFFLFCRVSLW
jgi:hypothetical protein